MTLLNPSVRIDHEGILHECSDMINRAKELTPSVKEDIEKLIAWVNLYQEKLMNIEYYIQSLIDEQKIIEKAKATYHG